MTDIKTLYPGAEEGEAYTEKRVKTLQTDYGFDLDKTILAASVCSDEIIRSATNFRDYVAVETPFQLGGLAGFPFTGLTGFGAFSAHIPEDGAAIIIYGPHIGMSEKQGIGKVIRSGQHKESSCCGALVGAVNTLQSDDAGEPDRDYDYQQWKLIDELKEGRDQIVSSDDPLSAATDIMFDKISARIKSLVEKSSPQLSNLKIALLGGIIINTDAGKADWFEEREFDVRTF